MLQTLLYTRFLFRMWTYTVKGENQNADYLLFYFVFLHVGDSNITNCISRSQAHIPRSTTSVFLNLWLRAAHDVFDGNKKNRLKNTLLNTHTSTHTNFICRAGDETLCSRKNGPEILVFFKFKWYWHYDQILQSLPFSKLQKHSYQPCNEVHTSFSLHFAQIMMEDSILIHKWAPVL